MHFENAASRAKANVILMSSFYVCYYALYWRWRNILWWPQNSNNENRKAGL